MDVSNTTRIVMLGKTGTGKSSLANTIFGEKLFTIGHTLNSETRECRAETKSVNGRSITLIDTPSFFDTDRPEEELKPEIVRCITECAPGPHVFLIVLKVEKHTKHEQAVITEINQYFSEEVSKYATVVFTHGDQLDEGQTIEDFVRKNTLVSDLVKKCGDRCHVVDNKYWKNNQQDEYRSNKFQVAELLNTTDKIVLENKGGCYTKKMLQEEELIRQSSGNMSDGEVREQATGKVKLVGLATGALLGAVFGLVLMVGEVIAVLKKSLSEPGQLQGPLIKIAAALGARAGGGLNLGAIVAAFVGAGVVKGAFTGYDAAEGADSPQEAAKRAAKALKNEAMSTLEALCIRAR